MSDYSAGIANLVASAPSQKKPYTVTISQGPGVLTQRVYGANIGEAYRAAQALILSHPNHIIHSIYEENNHG